MPPLQFDGTSHLRDVEAEGYQSDGGAAQGPLILVALLGGAMVICEFRFGLSTAFLIDMCSCGGDNGFGHSLA